jgi:hypothetical protein
MFRRLSTTKPTIPDNMPVFQTGKIRELSQSCQIADLRRRDVSKRSHAREHLIHAGPQRIQIIVLRDWRIPRRSWRVKASICRGHASGLVNRTTAEIRGLELALVVQKHVVGRQVAMNDTKLMDKGQPLGHCLNSQVTLVQGDVLMIRL